MTCRLEIFDILARRSPSIVEAELSGTVGVVELINPEYEASHEFPAKVVNVPGLDEVDIKLA